MEFVRCFRLNFRQREAAERGALSLYRMPAPPPTRICGVYREHPNLSGIPPPRPTSAAAATTSSSSTQTAQPLRQPPYLSTQGTSTFPPPQIGLGRNVPWHRQPTAPTAATWQQQVRATSRQDSLPSYDSQQQQQQQQQLQVRLPSTNASEGRSEGSVTPPPTYEEVFKEDAN